MKKRKKKLFQKTLAYLMILVAVVAAFFWAVNYVTSQKLSMNSEASVNKCQAFKKNNYNNCGQVKTKSKDIRNFIPCGPGKPKDPKYIYCRAVDIVKGNDCKQVGGSDWYSEKAYLELTRSKNKTYSLTIEDLTLKVGKYYQSQHKNKKCLIVKYVKKPTCSELKGDWRKTCSFIEGDKSYFSFTYPNSEGLSDYKAGKVCCKQGGKIPQTGQSQNNAQ